MDNSTIKTTNDLDQLCINTIRTLCMDAVQQANSGHPGAPMGLAPAAYTLWTRVMKHNSQNPDWLDRDRFVLSGGHASTLLYSLLHLSGYGLSLDELKNFRQWQSKTPGHPEYGHTIGVETTTGPLGQGFSNAVGMAMAERHLAARFNRPDYPIVDHFTYVMCGDGDMMEGIVAESASLAGHLGLSRLICLYDDNRISIEGGTDLAFTEDVARRFMGYGWQVIRVTDGNDVEAIEKALDEAGKETEKPSLVMLRTHIAYGSPNKQDTAGAHGAPLGEDEIRLTKKNLGWDETTPFHVPVAVRDAFETFGKRGEQAQARWQENYTAYTRAFPELAEQWVDAVSGFLPLDWEDSLPAFKPSDGPVATRAASGTVLNAIAEKVPTLIGGSADLAPSNKTYLSLSHDFQKNAYDGRNIRFGVREHAMGGILSGMFLHHGVRPYGGTFLVFADYLRPSIRLACLMKLPIIYVFTHDSVAVGEDGPTHQPVEQLAALRAIPGLTVVRPAEATETAEAWRLAVRSTSSPFALILSRQKLDIIDRKKYAPAAGVMSGAYILADADGTPDVILIASGSEVQLAMQAREALAGQNIGARVVSMPSWELFEKTSKSYQKNVLPPQVKARLVIEAGVSMGWERYAGDKGAVIGIDRFGASAPGGRVMAEYGFTIENVVARAVELVKRGQA